MMMSQSQYSLSWDAHVRNVCDGLSSLQQNGEFVDMTLAADGHMVKVHQVVLALSSPYFKDLITSAQCPHPVIFLNKVTHVTLSAILEYIYTGEVLVSLEHLNDLIEAARELHIKGLKDMKIHPTPSADTQKHATASLPAQEVLEGEDVCLFQVTREEEGNVKDQEQEYEVDIIQYSVKSNDYEKNQLMQQDIVETQDTLSSQDQDAMDNNIEQEALEEIETIEDDEMSNVESKNRRLEPGQSALQYTVSNQGSLQMILNRYVYYLKHTNRDRSRQWRCVDYLNHAAKCPALVFTHNDIVVQRVSAHTHPFHDKKILKKLRSGAIYSAFTEAKKEGEKKKRASVIISNR